MDAVRNFQKNDFHGYILQRVQIAHKYKYNSVKFKSIILWLKVNNA